MRAVTSFFPPPHSLQAGIAADDTVQSCLIEALDDGRNEILGNGTADGLVLDGNTLALFVRGQLDHNVSVLTATTGLLDEFPFASGWIEDCFLVSDLWLA